MMGSDFSRLMVILRNAEEMKRATARTCQQLADLAIDSWIGNCAEIAAHCLGNVDEFRELMLKHDYGLSEHDAHTIDDLIGIESFSDLLEYLRGRLQRKAELFPFRVEVYRHEHTGPPRNHLFVITPPNRPPA